MFLILLINREFEYRISSNKRRAQTSGTPLGIHIEISASPLINAAPLNTALIRTVTIFC